MTSKIRIWVITNQERTRVERKAWIALRYEEVGIRLFSPVSMTLKDHPLVRVEQ